MSLGWVLGAGCSEWDKYWDSGGFPTGPEPVADTTPPTVTLVTPDGPDSSQATPMTGTGRVVVEAADDVAVERVELRIDDAPGIGLAGPPWEFLWDTTPLGEGSYHVLRATATDRAGNTGTSPAVYAQVFNAGPEVVLTDPADGALVSGSIEIRAGFPGQPPEIARVEFLAGVEILAVVTSPPWATTLDTQTLPAGEHFLTAKATTTLGQVGVSPPVRIHVNNGSPVVTIDFPANGHAVAMRGTLPLSGSAVDGEEGEIPPARMSWRSDLQGSLGTGRSLRIANLAVGTHTITASAVNAWGKADSASIQVDVLAQPTYGFCADILQGVFQDYFCTFCHDPQASEFPASELDLRSYASLMAGGKTTAYETIFPCRPESSLVWNKLTQPTPWVGVPMPPNNVFPPLPPEILEMLRVWILEGAAPDDPQECP